MLKIWFYFRKSYFWSLTSMVSREIIWNTHFWYLGAGWSTYCADCSLLPQLQALCSLASHRVPTATGNTGFWREFLSGLNSTGFWRENEKYWEIYGIFAMKYKNRREIWRVLVQATCLQLNSASMGSAGRSCVCTVYDLTTRVVDNRPYRQSRCPSRVTFNLNDKCVYLTRTGNICPYWHVMLTW